VEGLQKKGRQKNVNPKEPEKIDGISWCSVVKVKVGIQFPLLLPVCHCLFWGVCEFIYWRRLASFLPSCLSWQLRVALAAAIGQHFSAGFIYLQAARVMG